MKRYLVFISLFFIAFIGKSQYIVTELPSGNVRFENTTNGVVNHYTSSTCMYAWDKGQDDLVIVYNKNGGEVSSKYSASSYTINGVLYSTPQTIVDAFSELKVFQCGLLDSFEISITDTLDVNVINDSLKIYGNVDTDLTEIIDSITVQNGRILSAFETLDTSSIDTNNLAPTNAILIDIVNQLTSIASIPFDTTQVDTSLTSMSGGGVSDSVFIKENTDSLTVQNSVRQEQLDSIISLINMLLGDTIPDTAQVIVWDNMDAYDVSGINVDTLKYCNELSFVWGASSSGSFTIKYPNGNTRTYTSASGVTPFFQKDNSFYEYFIVDATSAVDLWINSNCQSTPCIKLDDLLDCDTEDIIEIIPYVRNGTAYVTNGVLYVR